MALNLNKILILLIITFTTMSITYAQNDSVLNQSNIDDDELAILQDGLGAQMRLLQLKKRVNFQIESANLILLNLNNSEVNMTQLNNIINGLENIIIEINQTNFNTTNKSELAEEYVALKAEAIDLSKEFKLVITPYLTEELKIELKTQIKNKEKVKFEVEDKQVQKLRKQFNLQQLNELLDAANINATDLLSKYQESNLSLEQIKLLVAQQLGTLSNEDKVRLNVKLKNKKESELQEGEKLKEELKVKVDDKRVEIRRKSKDRENIIKEKIRIKKDKVRIEFEEDGKKRRFEIREKEGEEDEIRIDGIKEEKIEELIQDAKEEIEKAKEKIEEVKAEGKDVTEALIYLELAEDLLKQGENAFVDLDFEKAEKLLKDSKQNAMWARGKGINSDDELEEKKDEDKSDEKDNDKDEEENDETK